ncbi:unknown protein [Seminavis robusta]|uniref:Uncharacterized protein n=1 Tax=Seminavis robusta TaxID=568900 RepID=A0A9N8HPY1_9STRA|nr:unknown protein [Seminavis robusta]|eukprot:Sro1375_g267401.1  (142) ;mRNA; f:24477-24902
MIAEKLRVAVVLCRPWYMHDAPCLSSDTLETFPFAQQFWICPLLAEWAKGCFGIDAPVEDASVEEEISSEPSRDNTKAAPVSSEPTNDSRALPVLLHRCSISWLLTLPILVLWLLTLELHYVCSLIGLPSKKTNLAPSGTS